MEKIHKKEKGITIITLVITIIILLILAGISIAALVGNDGLINKAKKAKSDYENAQEEELAMLDEYGNFIDSKSITSENNESNNGTSDEKVLERISSLEEQMKNLHSNTFLLDKVYPIGCVYISISNTDPSTLFGGTWETYGQGRTLVGVGTGNDGSIDKTFTANSTGGEYNHILSVSEMPKHTHQSRVWVPGSFSATDITSGRFKGLAGIRCESYYSEIINVYSEGGDIQGGGTGVLYSGESQPHNNIQPYITVYMWKRVS